MAVRIQQCSGQDSLADGFSSAIFGSSVAVGDIVVVACFSTVNLSNDCNISDDGLNTWIRVISTPSATINTDIEFWYSIITTGGTLTITNTPTSAGNSGLICEEWTQPMSSPTDISNGNAPTKATTNFTSGSFATNKAYEVLFCASVTAAFTTVTAGTGWSNLNSVTDFFSTKLSLESQIVTVIGTYNGAMTASPSSFYSCIGMGLKFKEIGRPQVSIMG